MKRSPRRAGTTLLEILAALVVLAIALAGLCPLMIVQLKLLRRIESQPIPNNPQVIRGVRMVGDRIYVPAGQPYVPAGQPYVLEDQVKLPPVTVLQPQPNDWVRRLGVAATFQTIRASTQYDDYPVLTALTLDHGAAVLMPTVDNWPLQGSADGYNGGDYRSSVHLGDSATWTFGPIGPGLYRVMIAWPQSVPIPDDAKLTFTDRGGNDVAVKVKDSTPILNVPWRDLGGNYSLGASLVLKLDGASGTVADAVRIGPRNDVMVQPRCPSDPSPTSGAVAVRVKVVSRP